MPTADNRIVAREPLGALEQRFISAGTAAVSDAMDSMHLPSVLAGIRARCQGVTTCGPAYTVRYRARPPSEAGFKSAADYIDDVAAGDVVVIDNDGRVDCTTWGGLLTQTAQSRGVAGTVIHGSVRDVDEIRARSYGLFSTGITMVSGKNRVELDAQQIAITIGGLLVRPGDLILGDDNGVLRVPLEAADEIAALAENVRATERRIAGAISTGVPLGVARTEFGYATPWQTSAT